MRVGVYPAAFDPVHEGHLGFARAAMKAHGLDKVFFLPEPNPSHKQGVKALEHRANMVQLAIANEPNFGVIMLDTQDFSIQHIWPRITSRFMSADMFMLIGNNPIRRLSAWPHATEFGRTAPTFVVAKRNNPGLEQSIQTLLHTKKMDLPYEILKPDYKTFSTPAIRRAIKAGEQPKGLPYAVFEYIKRNKLYHG